MELTLSLVFVVSSRWESDSSPDRKLIHRRLDPIKCWYSFTNPGRIESGVGLGGKKGCTNIRISAKPGSSSWPCGQKAEILPTVPTMKSPKNNKIPQKFLWTPVNKIKCEWGSLCQPCQLTKNESSSNLILNYIWAKLHTASHLNFGLKNVLQKYYQDPGLPQLLTPKHP